MDPICTTIIWITVIAASAMILLRIGTPKRHPSSQRSELEGGIGENGGSVKGEGA